MFAEKQVEKSKSIQVYYMKRMSRFEKSLNIVFSFVLMITFFHCAGIGGDQVAGDDEFKKRFEVALKAKVFSCNLLDPIARNAALIFWKDPSDSKNPLSFLEPSSYYTQRDIDFCEKAINSTPCGTTMQEFTSNHTLTILMYCRPKTACILDKTHMGHGMWCVR